MNRDELARKQETKLTAQEHLLVRDGDITYNTMRMWQGAFGRATRDGIVSPAYVVLRSNQDADSRFFEYGFGRGRSIYLFWAYSYGLTKDRLRLYANDFARIPFTIPTLPEQRKIADFLTAVDERIGQLTRKQALLEEYKKGVMQQLFTQAIRFKDDDGNDFPDWEEKEFLEQMKTVPTKEFQIKSSTVLEEGRYRVIDQGKVRVAGYSDDSSKVMRNLPVIVFGDHTTVIKYIDFEFIVGADGTKLLVSQNPESDLRFLYYNLIQNNVVQEGYKRHFSILKEISFQMPSPSEQTKIADFLSALDRKIEAVAAQITETQTFKRGLLQQMFV